MKSEEYFGLSRNVGLDSSSHKLSKWLYKHGWNGAYKIHGNRTYYFAGDGKGVICITRTCNKTCTFTASTMGA